MSGTAASNPELTAVCHLLPMDTGLFCVSLAEPTAGMAGPHFPGVRISLPPGPQSEHAGVTISTFRADGWLDHERPAALVHVSQGRGHVMLTIYHEATQPRDAAPRLMITQLGQLVGPHPGGPAPGPGTRPAPGPASVTSRPTGQSGPSGSPPSAGAPFVTMAPTPPQIVTGAAPSATSSPAGAQAAAGAQTSPAEARIMAHVHNRGDVQGRLTDWVGLPGGRLWIEGFGVTLPPGSPPGEIEYQGVSAAGLTPWMSAPDYCGSRGQSQPLLGLAIRLKGDAARLYDCSYRATFVDGSTGGPTGHGQLCQSPSQAGLEAFQLTLARR